MTGKLKTLLTLTTAIGYKVSHLTRCDVIILFMVILRTDDGRHHEIAETLTMHFDKLQINSPKNIEEHLKNLF